MINKRILAGRASEARDIVNALLAKGMSMTDIADGAHVGQRTIYRWQREGTAPHPAMLHELRRLMGNIDGSHSEDRE
jgi:DNA invertase Pin-like site-specific DNA recombinase